LASRRVPIAKQPRLGAAARRRGAVLQSEFLLSQFRHGRVPAAAASRAFPLTAARRIPQKRTTLARKFFGAVDGRRSMRSTEGCFPFAGASESAAVGRNFQASGSFSKTGFMARSGLRRNSVPRNTREKYPAHCARETDWRSMSSGSFFLSG